MVSPIDGLFFSGLVYRGLQYLTVGYRCSVEVVARPQMPSLLSHHLLPQPPCEAAEEVAARKLKREVLSMFAGCVSIRLPMCTDALPLPTSPSPVSLALQGC